MEERLKVPIFLLKQVFHFLNFRHRGRDGMLREAADVVDVATECNRCLESTKILKRLLRQSPCRKPPEAINEVPLEFAGPSQIARQGNIILSLKRKTSSWPEARSLPRFFNNKSSNGFLVQVRGETWHYQK